MNTLFYNKKFFFIVTLTLCFLKPSFSQLQIMTTFDNPELVGRVKTFGEISSSLIYFSENNKYLLTFLNRSYPYKNESFWLNEVSKNELYELINSELILKEKNKRIKIQLEENRILSLEMHKKKMALNIWDGTTLYKSSIYKLKHIRRLFEKDKGKVYTKLDGTVWIE